MSTHRIVPAAVAAAFALITALPADAKPNAKPPKVKPTAAKAMTVKPTTAHGPKTVTAKPSTVKVHGNATKAKTVKPAKVKGTGKATTTKTAQTSVDGAKSQKVKGNKATRQALADDATGSRPVADTNPQPADTNPDPGPRSLSKAQQHLLKNDKLRAKMAARLPGDIDPVIAAAGFKNLGQFVAAVNVSNNQGVDFKALRQLMLGDERMSLGQALQQLKGGDIRTANATADTAVSAANRDLAAADVNTTPQKTKRKSRG